MLSFVVHLILMMAGDENPSSYKGNFPLHNFPWLFQLVVHVFIVLDLLLNKKLRETGSFFQTPKLIQTVSRALSNLSKVFYLSL